MSQTTRKQALFFAIVGACAALTHFAVLVLLVQWGGMVPFWANPLAFVCAFCVSFYGHLSWTFRAHTVQGHWLPSLWRWLLSSIGGFLLNQSLFAAGLSVFGHDHYRSIWFVVTLLVTLMTFALAKFWAFRRPHSPQNTAS